MSDLLEQLQMGELNLPPQAALDAEKRRRSLSEFTKYYWPLLNPATPLLWNWHLDVICRYLERVSAGEIQRLVIAVPPGSCKSTLVSVMWMCWEWLPGNKPSEETIFLSSSLPLALRDSEKCRVILQSDEYQTDAQLLAHFNDDETWEFSATENAKDIFKNTKRGARECFSIGADLTGHRGNKVVIDDPIDVKEVINTGGERVMERMTEVNVYYKNKAASRRNDPVNGAEVLIMQALHKHDLRGVWLSELQPDRKQVAVVLPMEYDPDTEWPCPEDPRTEPGELLDKNRYPQYWVDALKVDPVFADQYQAQYNQKPVSLDGELFKKEYFKQTYTWRGEDWRKNANIPQLARVFMFADCANKVKKKKNNYTVIGVIGQAAKTGDYYLLFLLRKKLTQPQLIATAEELLPQQNADGFVIEDAGNGIGLIQHLDAPDSAYRKYNIIAKIAHKDKETRARNTLHVYAKNRVWIPDNGCPWIQAFKDEHLDFPQVAFDDQVDFMSMGINYFEDNRINPSDAMFMTDDGRLFVNGVEQAGEERGSDETLALGIYPVTQKQRDEMYAHAEPDQGEELWKLIRSTNQRMF